MDSRETHYDSGVNCYVFLFLFSRKQGVQFCAVT